MVRIAKYVKDIVIQDPDTGGDVDITIFKHEGGGMFGIDSSYIDQVAEEDTHGNPVVKDPFSEPSGDIVTLIWPNEEKQISKFFKNA